MLADLFYLKIAFSPDKIPIFTQKGPKFTAKTCKFANFQDFLRNMGQYVKIKG